MIATLRLRLMKRRALSAYQEGDFTTAHSLFQRILDAEPGSPGARHNLALTNIAMGNYEEAERLLLQELEDFGEYYPRLRALADLYYVGGRREEANAYYRRCSASDPPEGDVDLLRKRIELTDDEARYDRVKRAHESFADGNRLMQEQRWDEAISAFTRAADFDETNIHAMNNAGSIYLNHKSDPKQAAGFFRRALRWSNMPWIRRNLLQAEKADGDSTKRTGAKR
ncbi:MAG: hypothetical protein EA403_13685 [Spirochaetaceae bacterium]|nr:MAG: hypothetical protein EA403_13685 [Spirochaetaceae bacterium]